MYSTTLYVQYTVTDRIYIVIHCTILQYYNTWKYNEIVLINTTKINTTWNKYNEYNEYNECNIKLNTINTMNTIVSWIQ